MIPSTARRYLQVATSALQCLVNGEENPQNCPFPLSFRHPARGGPSHGYRQHAQKFGEGRARGSEDILSDRQTDRQTDTHTQTDATDATDHNTSQSLPRAKQ